MPGICRDSAGELSFRPRPPLFFDAQLGLQMGVGVGQLFDLLLGMPAKCWACSTSTDARVSRDVHHPTATIVPITITATNVHAARAPRRAT